MFQKTIFDLNDIDFIFAKKIRNILLSSLKAVDPIIVMKNALKIKNDTLEIQAKKYCLSSFQKIFLIGLGKASQAMVLGAMRALSKWELSGLTITKHVDLEIKKELLPGIKTIIGSHPIPYGKSLAAAEELVEFTKNVGEKDLVLCLISGGGSALVTKPAKGIELADIQRLTAQLLKCGADINEINTIRKHLDELKGGGLLKYLYPAQVLTIILSDVIGDDLSMIASGPTVADRTTFKDALNIIEKYNLFNFENETIVSHLREGKEGKAEETLKEEDPRSKLVQNVIIGNNHLAAIAAKKMAEAIGFNCMILEESIVGDSIDAGKKIGFLVKDFIQKDIPLIKPMCVILGGESTVKVKGDGKGGRNQEVALSCAIEIDGLENVCIATLATDGEDGPTDAAGAIVTGKTVSFAREKGLDPQRYLDDNDSYHFFNTIGGLIKTGATGTNVNDLNFIFLF